MNTDKRVQVDYQKLMLQRDRRPAEPRKTLWQWLKSLDWERAFIMGMAVLLGLTVARLVIYPGRVPWLGGW